MAKVRIYTFPPRKVCQQKSGLKIRKDTFFEAGSTSTLGKTGFSGMGSIH